MAMQDFPMPPELAVDFEPLSEHDLARYFDAGPSDAEAVEHPEDYTEDAVRRSTIDRWRIEQDDEAEWAFRKLALAEAEIRQLREQAAEWEARIVAWFDRKAARSSQTAGFMRERLEDYGLRLRAAGGGKTFEFPSGTVSTSEVRPAVVVEDDESVAAYVEGLVDTNKAWVKALADAEFEIEDVIRRDAKVYAVPFRKLARIGEESDGFDMHVVLSCGHVIEEVVALVDDHAIPSRGDRAVCRVCREADEVFPAVEVVTMTARKRAVVVGPDGEPVPGATVRPGSVTAKVDAR